MSGYPPCAICGEMPAATIHALTPQPLEAGTRFAPPSQHGYECDYVVRWVLPHDEDGGDPRQGLPLSEIEEKAWADFWGADDR